MSAAGSKNESVRVLVADDQADIREALRLLLKAEGYATEVVSNPHAALEAVQTNEFDIMLMDLNYQRDTTSGKEGMDLLARIQAADGKLPVVVMTAWGSVELAVEAMRRGARDFIQKPWDNARVSAILKTQIELGRALRKGQRLEAENRALRAERFPQLVAQSAAMRPVSLRAARPLVTVNTGGLAEGIFESELFGHVKGAFTDAKADRVGRFEM